MGWAIPWAGPYPGLGHTLGWAIPWAGHREAQGGGATRAGGGDGREWVAATCWAAQVERGDQGKVDKGDTVQVPRVPWRNPRAREAKSCPYLFIARRAVATPACARTVCARGEQGLESGGREGGGQGNRVSLRGDKHCRVLVRRRALVYLQSAARRLVLVRGRRRRRGLRREGRELELQTVRVICVNFVIRRGLRREGRAVELGVGSRLVQRASVQRAPGRAR